MFHIKRNDTSPSISCSIDIGGTAVDLTGTDVKFIMRKEGASAATVAAAAVIVSALGGIVRYDWQAADTAIAGLYAVEWEVTFSGGTKRTFPQDGYLYVNVLSDLA